MPKQPKMKNYRIRRFFRGIGAFGDRVVDAVEKAVDRSAICKWFSDYPSFGKEGIIAKTFGWLSKQVRKLRRSVTLKIENSAIVNALSGLIQLLLQTDLRSWGVALGLMGAITSVGELFKGARFSFQNGDNSVLLFGLILTLLSLVLLTGKDSLGKAIWKSKILHFVALDILCIDEELLVADRAKQSHILAAAVGVVFGAVGMVLPFWSVLTWILIALELLIVMNQPEIGLIVCIIVFPFVETEHLMAMALVSIFAFFIKVFRGKRVIRIGWIDIFVLLFGGFVLMNGLLLSDEISFAAKTVAEYLVSICLYFCIANSMAKKHWVMSATDFLLMTGSIYAIMATIPFFTNYSPENWQSSEALAKAFGLVQGRFGSPASTSELMALLIPVAVAGVAGKKGALKVFSVVALSLMTVCLALTGYSAAWLWVAIVIIWMVVIYNVKVLKAIPFVAAAVVTLAFALPDIVTDFIVRILNAVTPMNGYVSTWQGVSKILQYHWVSGVGLGNDNFKNAYYAYLGVKGVTNSGSFYFQMITAMGLFAFVIFVSLAVTVAKLAFNGYYEMNKDSSGIHMLGFGGGLIALLLVGLTDNVWNCPQLLFGFWVLLGVMVACNRTYKALWNDTERGD